LERGWGVTGASERRSVRLEASQGGRDPGLLQSQVLLAAYGQDLSTSFWEQGERTQTGESKKRGTMKIGQLGYAGLVFAILLLSSPAFIEAADREKLLTDPGVYGTFAVFKVDEDWWKTMEKA